MFNLHYNHHKITCCSASLSLCAGCRLCWGSCCHCAKIWWVLWVCFLVFFSICFCFTTLFRFLVSGRFSTSISELPLYCHLSQGHLLLFDQPRIEVGIDVACRIFCRWICCLLKFGRLERICEELLFDGFIPDSHMIFPLVWVFCRNLELLWFVSSAGKGDH